MSDGFAGGFLFGCFCVCGFGCFGCWLVGFCCFKTNKQKQKTHTKTNSSFYILACEVIGSVLVFLFFLFSL